MIRIGQLTVPDAYKGRALSTRLRNNWNRKLRYSDFSAQQVDFLLDTLGKLSACFDAMSAIACAGSFTLSIHGGGYKLSGTHNVFSEADKLKMVERLKKIDALAYSLSQVSGEFQVNFDFTQRCFITSEGQEDVEVS